MGARPCHRLRGSASPVLTATGFVNGKGQFSIPHRVDTPQPITKKFVTGDYVGDPNGCAKLGAYPSTGGFWACLLYTSPSPRDGLLSRMPSSA